MTECWLISKSNRSTTVKYKGSTLIIGPCARVKISDEKQLGKLPDGIRKVPIVSETPKKNGKKKADNGGNE